MAPSNCQRWLGSLRGIAIAFVLGSLLTACSLPRMIDSNVESFTANPPISTGAPFRFERLPSQQAQALAQDHLELITKAALERVGLIYNTQQARYSVQANLRIVQFQPPPRRSPRFYGPMVDAYGNLYPPYPILPIEPTWYSHSVHLVMRDLRSGQVTFETTATFDGPWTDTVNLLPPIMDAALHDFPAPPAGVRRVVVELPVTGEQR